MSERKPDDSGELLDRAAYREWVAGQPGRWELDDGRPVAMAPEMRAHNVLKTRMYEALAAEVRRLGLACEAAVDGITVEIDDSTDFIPDALVNCGPPIPIDSVAAPNPVVVVEVLSRGTMSVDTGRKLIGYFQVPSIQHYLVVRTDRRQILHHQRDGARIATKIVTSGEIVCDPPGLSIKLEDIYAGVVG
jgi:Uma2 family endonuclease